MTWRSDRGARSGLVTTRKAVTITQALEQAPQAQLRSSRKQADAVLRAASSSSSQPSSATEAITHRNQRDAPLPGCRPRNPGRASGRAGTRRKRSSASAAHDPDRAVDDWPWGRRERGQRRVPGQQYGERPATSGRQDQRAPASVWSSQCGRVLARPPWRHVPAASAAPAATSRRDHSGDQECEHRTEHLRGMSAAAATRLRRCRHYSSGV